MPASHGFQTQGKTHLERGQNFEKLLNDIGGLPDTQTIDWVKGVSHDNEAMMDSESGLDKVCYRFSSYFLCIGSASP